MATTSLFLHGNEYELTLSTSAAADAVQLELMQPSGELWSGNFDAHYVEEITQRAGSFKKFAVFLQMLRSALEEGGSVSLDILTYADLQALKRRKAGQPEGGAQTSAGAANNKRYIIVTYESQFDRVHYPLPLSPGEARRPAQAQTEGQHALPASSGGVASQQQQEQLLQEKGELQSAYERLQRDSSREVSRLRKQCDGLAQELGEQAEQVSALRDELQTHGGNARVVEKLRTKLQELERHTEEERTDFHRVLSKHKKEVILLNTELSRAKKEEERARTRARQLEAELKVVQRRAAAAGAGPRLPSRPASNAGSRPASNAGSRPASNAGSRPASNAGSRPASNAGSRPASRASSAERTRPTTARAGAAGGSRSSSRASSVSSSTAASRAGSVERSRGSRTAEAAVANARAWSQASSAAGSRVSSRAGSARGSAPSSRASSTERSRPPSRDARPALPSLERAAREVLLQTSRQQRQRGLAANAAGGGGAAASKGHRPTSAKRGLAAGASLPQQQGRQSGSDARGTAKATTRAPACQPTDASASEAHGTQHVTGAALATRPSGSENSGNEMSGHASTALRKEGVDPSLAAEPSYDASQDIADIDRRLSALQDFLKAAKAPR